MSFKEDLPGLFLVSRVTVVSEAKNPEEIAVRVKPATGHKCERCWNWRDSVGKKEQHPTLCHRCVEVVLEGFHG